MLGRSIEPDTWVVYSVKSGSYQYTTIGKVVEILENLNEDFRWVPRWAVKVQPLLRSGHIKYDTGEVSAPKYKINDKIVTITAIQRLVVVEPTEYALQLLNGE